MKRSVGDKKISLVNCKPQIKKILVISRFDEQFNIT
jgi:anti-anti-sigma regulatory factor